MGNGYANVKVDPTDAKKLQAVLKAVGINSMPAEKMHVTLMYDTRNPEIDPGVKKDTFYIAKVVGVERMGEPGSKWEAVALKLECPELKGRHLALRARGFKHSYPSMDPHMSIGYGADVVKKLPLIEKLFEQGKFPDKLHLGNENWDKIKED